MCMSALVLVVNGQILAAKQGDEKKWLSSWAAFCKQLQTGTEIISGM